MADAPNPATNEWVPIWNLLGGATGGGGGGGGSSTAVILVANHPTRPSASGLTNGTLLVELDRLTQFIAVNGAWQCIGGMMYANFAQRPTDLGTTDNGFQWYCLDYGHLFAWNGSDWIWGAGESGNMYLQDFHTNPDSQRWAFCDGTVVNVLRLSPLREEAVATPSLVAFPSYRRSASTYGFTPASNTLAVSVTAAGAHSHGLSNAGIHAHVAAAIVAGAHAHGGLTADAGDHSHGLPTHAFYGIDPGDSHPAFLQSPTFNAGNHSHAVSTDSQGNHSHTVTVENNGDHSHGVSTDGSHAHTAAITGSDQPNILHTRVYLRR